MNLALYIKVRCKCNYSGKCRFVDWVRVRTRVRVNLTDVGKGGNSNLFDFQIDEIGQSGQT